MAIKLDTFLARAEKGGTLQLSSKSTDTDMLLAKRKSGILDNRVVNWLRGSKAQRLENNKLVTTLFLDAIKERYGAQAADTLRARIEVDEGKPLHSRVVIDMSREAEGVLAARLESDARFLKDAAENLVRIRQEAAADAKVVAGAKDLVSQELKTFFAEPVPGNTHGTLDSPGAAYRMADDAMNSIGMSDDAKAGLRRALADPGSELATSISAAFKKAIEPKIDPKKSVTQAEIRGALVDAFETEVLAHVVRLPDALEATLVHGKVTFANSQHSVSELLAKDMFAPAGDEQSQAGVASKLIGLADKLLAQTPPVVSVGHALAAVLGSRTHRERLTLEERTHGLDLLHKYTPSRLQQAIEEFVATPPEDARLAAHDPNAPPRQLSEYFKAPGAAFRFAEEAMASIDLPADAKEKLKQQLADPKSELVTSISKAFADRTQATPGKVLSEGQIQQDLVRSFMSAFLVHAGKDEALLSAMLSHGAVVFAGGDIKVGELLDKLAPKDDADAQGTVLSRVLDITAQLLKAGQTSTLVDTLTALCSSQEPVGRLSADDRVRAFTQLRDASEAEAKERLKLAKRTDAPRLGSNDKIHMEEAKIIFALLLGAADAQCAVLNHLQEKAGPGGQVDIKETERLDDFIRLAGRALEVGGQPMSETAPTSREIRKFVSDSRSKMRELVELAGAKGTRASGREWQAFISSRARELTGHMVRRAVETLGTPPCKFETLTLGSTSRGEGAPFSDLEFGFLLPSGLTPADRATAEEYLQRAAMLVHLQVVGLGESGNLGLPAGMEWDGVFNPADQPKNLIGTADELCKLGFATSDDRPTDAFLFTMYANAEGGVFGWAPEGDDSRELVNEFVRKGAQTLKEPHGGNQANAKETRGQLLGHWLTREAVEVCSGSGMLPSQLQEAIKENRKDVTVDVTVDVKLLSRLPLLMTHGLVMLNVKQGHELHSTLLRVEALVKAKIFTKKEGANVLAAMDTLAAVRVKSHLAAGMEQDRVKLTDYEELESAIDILASLERKMASKK